MEQADSTTARYLRRNEIFADMFNFFLYNGEEVINPDSLRELDTREIEVPYGGTEGAEHWDGPRSLHEMFEQTDEKALTFVQDYRINLVEPAAIADDAFENFHSTLKEVLEFIKYSADPDKLIEAVDADDAFQHLGRTEMGVLKACVNKNLPLEQDKEEEETVNMKDAITILEERAAKEAAEKAKVENALQNIKGLMKTMGWTAEQAMDNMELPDRDRAAILERL